MSILLPKSAIDGAKVMNLGKAIFDLAFAQILLKRQMDLRVISHSNGAADLCVG